MKLKLKSKLKSKNLILFLLVLLFLLILLIFIFKENKIFEGLSEYNTDFPQINYSPNNDNPIPTALDGTAYISPDSTGQCPKGFERDQSDINSLCHGKCKPGQNFYKLDSTVYGCVALNRDYDQKNYSPSNNKPYPIADDTKTSYVSPNLDAKCPVHFKLDTKSGLCHTACTNKQLFYGMNPYSKSVIGCTLISTAYPQTQYDGSDNHYPITNDGTTQYVSPTSNALCPKNFVLDYPSGLCHTQCKDNKKFNGDKSGNSIIGCQ